MVLTLEIRRASRWGVVLRLGIHAAGRIVLSLRDRRAWGWGIVLGLGIGRGSMLHPQSSTENAHWGTRLDLRWNDDQAGTIVLRLGDRLSLGVGDCSALWDSPGEHVASPVVYRECALGDPLGFAEE